MRMPCVQFSMRWMIFALTFVAIISWTSFTTWPATAPNAPRSGDQRPRIVEVHPADGAAGVQPDTDLRIRFDRPMDPTLAVLEWVPGGEAGYRLRGPMRYRAGTHEFTLPLRLTPGRKHDVTLNREGVTRGDGYEGFRAADGLAAATFRWSFTTARPKSTAGQRTPRAVSVSPPSASEVALFTPVELTFDQPMDPASYRLTVPELAGSVRGPVLADRVEYDPVAKRFSLPVQLPPNWNGELRLEGFRGTDGALAESITLNYRTLREPLSPDVRKRVEQASESAPLPMRLIDRICVMQAGRCQACRRTCSQPTHFVRCRTGTIDTGQWVRPSRWTGTRISLA